MFVKNNEARIHNLGGAVILNPGVNEVDDKAWKTALAGGSKDGKGETPKALQALLDEKKIEVVSASAAKASSSGDAPPPSTQSLSDMTVPEASDLIGQTFDRDLLARWRKEDERVGVRNAIDEQLEVLKLEESK